MSMMHRHSCGLVNIGAQALNIGSIGAKEKLKCLLIVVTRTAETNMGFPERNLFLAGEYQILEGTFC